ncbi:MAG TPA: ABC transporter ATP-binding protein [Nevskiaceae bacterium]|nr:ABC transporter ATP-binding protein [Nevskiaceae bacterium]
MLELDTVSKVYRSGLVQTHALRDVSLRIASGEFVAVMGPSGSGKTTLLNIVGLLERFESGRYHLDGEDLSDLSDERLSRLRNEKLGFIFQSFNLIHDLTVFENVELPLRYRRLKARERHRRVAAALEQTGLSARTDHLPAQLSGGQQQRVAIARALVGEPRLLLADEPTGNLDSMAAHDVVRMLEQINARGTAVLMVTHSQELAQRANRTIYLLDGQLTDFTVAAKPGAAVHAVA